MKVFSLVIFLVIASGTANAAKYLSEKPPFLKPCDLNDANFNRCFASNFQGLLQEWKNGVPGLKSVGKLDPLQVKRVRIQQNVGPALNLKAELQNMVTHGLSKSIIKEAILDQKRFVADFKLLLPKVRFESDYKAQGTLLALNINSHGKLVFEIENMDMSFHINLKLRDEGGFTFTDLDTLKLRINEIKNLHIDVQNLFGGQRELEDSANEILNENWQQLYEVLQPVLEETLQKIIDDRFGKIFSYVPASFFIQNIPTAKEFYG